MGSAERFCKVTKGCWNCIPSFVLEDRNKMINWIANLFNNKNKHSDIVRFIRTEYFKDVEHLTDDDVILYYNITHKRRKN